jgi:mono/diheme cytochrome c family protein
MNFRAAEKNQSPRRRINVSLLLALLGMLVGAAAVYAEADGSWLKSVPDADRAKANPFAGQTDAAPAGKQIFQERCAKCHGDDGEGRKKKPSLRSARVQDAKDGEIAWLLKNGNRPKGMPAFNALPEQTRWQVVSYVKSLGKSGLLSYAVGSEFRSSAKVSGAGQ